MSCHAGCNAGVPDSGLEQLGRRIDVRHGATLHSVPDTLVEGAEESVEAGV